MDYLQHGFRRRFERERLAVASLHQHLSPEQARHLWVGGELLAQLVDSLGRVGICQREAEFVPTMLNILNALDYWCREVDDTALGPVRWGDVSPESRGLFETITYDPVLLRGLSRPAPRIAPALPGARPGLYSTGMRARLRTLATLLLAIASLTAGMTPVLDRAVDHVGALCAGTGHSHEAPSGSSSVHQASTGCGQCERACSGPGQCVTSGCARAGRSRTAIAVPPCLFRPVRYRIRTTPLDHRRASQSAAPASPLITAPAARPDARIVGFIRGPGQSHDPRRAALWAAAVTVSITTRLAAQTDFRNLDDGRPTRAEDALPVDHYGFELALPYTLEARTRAGSI